MKILELRFKNLNSLYGEWLIDFTDPDYITNGIFALTGTTGAGKSTILDAICLALYGATPRLGRITKGTNEIMSRQTGECYAEVLFESQIGRFRCHWEQRRARKSASGNLQDPEHQIIDDVTGKPIETKKSLVTGVIEEKTGMDFDRFTRSILLAQGGFDTFLKADTEQKSKILEQITGTAIYTEISKRVHERRREEQEQLNLLQAQTEGIVVMSPEQEKELEEQRDGLKKEEGMADEQFIQTEKAITWLSRINELTNEIVGLVDETNKINNEIETFQPQRERLNRAISAALLDSSYATLTVTRKQLLEDTLTLKREEDSLPKLESSAKELEVLYQNAEQQSVKAKQERDVADPLIKKIRLLDQSITTQNNTIRTQQNDCQIEAEKINTQEKNKLKEQSKLEAASKDIESSEHYLKTHAQDEWLIKGLAGVEAELNHLRSKQSEIKQKERAYSEGYSKFELEQKKLTGYTKELSAQNEIVETASKEHQQAKNALDKLLAGRMLREYQSDKEHLLREQAFLTKITALEAHRNQLEDGKPCPLCGAEQHPFAQGNLPQTDETENKIKQLTDLIIASETQQEVIKRLEGAEAEARKHLIDLEKSQFTLTSDHKHNEKALTELTNSLTELRGDFAELKQKVLAKLLPLGITEICEENISSQLDQLRERLQLWQSEANKKTEIEKQMTNIKAEIARISSIIEHQNSALSEKKRHLLLLNSDYKKALDERKIAYGDKDPDSEELALNKRISDLEQTEKSARDQHNIQRQKLNMTITSIESLKKRIAQRQLEITELETSFTLTLQNEGFKDEEQFIAMRLLPEERDVLALKAKKIDDTRLEIYARRKDREQRLTVEKEKKITHKTLAELQPQFDKIKQDLKERRDSIAQLSHKLQENSSAKERIKAKLLAIENQKKECVKWDNLHSLIGSADGKKYRNFAQGLTFELMVSHANLQLEKMTDRYLLIRDESQPLELNVVDNYQAGEIRSTKNLSGGESFIVSLTLALGLSKMASRKVRVDSLFLDEGFGTLDEEVLETALEALSGLQQDGKLIGVISHISALKERIGTQITITSVSGGKSIIVGPGCRQVMGES